MRQIIIGFSTAKGFQPLSRLIQFVERRKFSHVYIRYTDDLTSEMMIAQASHGFVNEMSYDIFVQGNEIIEEFPLKCTEEQYKDVIKFIKKNLGRKYSIGQLVLIGIKKLFHFEVKQYNHDEAFICSEFGYRICNILGIEADVNADYQTPSDLNTLLKRNINI